MDDAELHREKARIMALVDKWLNPIGLQQWQITLDFHRGTIPGQDDADDFRTIACTRVKWEYQQARIDFNCAETQDRSDDGLEEVFVHEICHVLVAEMRPWNQKGWERQHEERVVTMLTNALLWTMHGPSTDDADQTIE